MPKLSCNCPKCKASLQFEAGGKTQLKIVCPKCQNPFQIKVPSVPVSAGNVGQQPTEQTPQTPQTSNRLPADLPPSEAFSDWPASPPPQSYNRPVANRHQFHRNQKTSFNLRVLVLPAVITAVSIGGLGLLGVAIMWGKQFLPAGSSSTSDLSSGGLASALSGSLFASDSRSSVEADLQSLRSQVEDIGRSIPSGDQSEASAKRLLAELPKFDELFRRACKLPAQARSLQEFAAVRAQVRDAIDRARSQPQSPNATATNLSSVPMFWSVKTNAQPDELVTQAINQITLSSHAVSTLMSDALIDYPDPLTYTGTEFEWSDEDKRVLAIIRLRGGLERDAMNVLAAVDVKAPSTSDLNKLHAHVDRAVGTAKELATLPGKSVGGMLVFVPKGNPYEPQQVSASTGLNRLHRLKEAEAGLPAEVNFLLEEVKAFGEMTEAILVGSQTGSSSQYLGTAATSSERFEVFVAAESKKKEDARLAEIAQKEEEKKMLAESQLHKQKAEEKQRQQEEERKRALEERMANARSGNMGGRLGTRGPDGLKPNIGPRLNSMDSPTGPESTTSRNMGNNGPNAGPSRVPGIGTGPSGTPQNRFQPPPGGQGDPAKMVTITASNVKNSGSGDYVHNAPKWLLQHSLSVEISNGNLKITLQNYDKPLADLESCFPMLVFEKIDASNRTITAKEK